MRAQVEIVEVATSSSAAVGVDADDHQLLLRGGLMRPSPNPSARSAINRSSCPVMRPALGANPTATRPSRWGMTPR